MEDYIYLLFLLAWLALSVFQQSQKKKHNAARKAAERARLENEYEQVQDQKSSPEPLLTPVEEPTGSLEELFQNREQEFVAEYETGGLEAKNNYDENAIEEQGVYQKSLEENLMNEIVSLEDYSETESSMITKNEAPDSDEELVKDVEYQYEKQFDLRKAVIYSEILNRKF
ncbi:MAG TPA: hypothetical protein PLI65_08090 [Bacteroidales bacterium]|nr:hypothetical protein [Bacteroidales bacterium]